MVLMTVMMMMIMMGVILLLLAYHRSRHGIVHAQEAGGFPWDPELCFCAHSELLCCSFLEIRLGALVSALLVAVF